MQDPARGCRRVGETRTLALLHSDRTAIGRGGSCNMRSSAYFSREREMLSPARAHFNFFLFSCFFDRRPVGVGGACNVHEESAFNRRLGKALYTSHARNAFCKNFWKQGYKRVRKKDVSGKTPTEWTATLDDVLENKPRKAR